MRFLTTVLIAATFVASKPLLRRDDPSTPDPAPLKCDFNAKLVCPESFTCCGPVENAVCLQVDFCVV
ncbi:hypothetical protein WG66_001948 [Moniliophthora roreri]|nr:hypothetical protein WG66_001948 [Moniliophthora roreri]